MAATDPATESRGTVPAGSPAARVPAGSPGAPQARAANAGAANRSRWGVGATATVALAGFMVVLTVLAMQLRNNPGSVGLATVKPRVVVVRRIYQTTVHERIIGATGVAGTTVQSSSASVSSPPTPVAVAPVTTRTS